MTKERDYFFDNAKAVLMFLVVLGHLLLPIHVESILVVVKRLIYVFHMPLFVFMSGYFAKTFYKNGRYNYQKVLYLLKAYIIFVVAIQLVYAANGYQKFSQINFFSQSGAPWYLLAMIAWYLTIPLVRRCHPLPVLAVSVVFALAAGFFRNIGDFLCLSRILVFGPFFYLGYYMERESMRKLLTARYGRIVLPVAGLLAGGILLFGQNLEDPLGMVYENFSYYEMENAGSGLMVRLMLLSAAVILSWALMFLAPKGRTRIFVIGENTMPIYMLHRILRDLLMFAGLYNYVEEGGLEVLVLFSALSVIMIVVLSRPGIVCGWNRVLALRLTRARQVPCGIALSNKQQV